MLTRRWGRGAGVLGIVLLVLGTGLLPAGTAVAAGRESGDPVAGVQVLESGPDGLTLAWSLPSFSTEEVMVEGNRYLQVQVAGLGLTGEPGHPQLPTAGLWLGLPEGAVSVEVLEAVPEEVPLAAPILPAPEIMVDPRPDAAVVEPTYRYVPAEAVYAQAAPYPGVLARLEEVGWMRSQRVGVLRLFPVQYSPQQGRLTLYRQMRLRVHFSAREGDAIIEPPAFEALFRSLLLNADQARSWRSRPSKTAAGGNPVPVSGAALKVLVNRDGLYRLDYALLQGAGLPVERIDPRTFALYLDGQEIPLWAPGEEDGRFQEEDALYFYGQATRSKYTDTNLYWLTWGWKNGRRMEVRSGAPGQAPLLEQYRAAVQREQNNIYWSKMPGGDDQERWVWQYLYNGTMPELTVDVDLQALPPLPTTATLRLALFGGLAAPVYPDHHVLAYVNDNLVGEGWWDGYEAVFLELPFPQEWLQEGPNTIRLVSPGDTGYSYDLFYVDWIGLDYHRRFSVSDDRITFDLSAVEGQAVELAPFSRPEIVALDIGDPQAPVRVVDGEVTQEGDSWRYRFAPGGEAGSAYWVSTPAQAAWPAGVLLDIPSTLRRSNNSADYVILAPADLLEAVRPLADRYTAHGVETILVDVQDVYDEFAGGRVTPQAIRDLLAYAYANWSKPPTYVLLVGDGHYDPKDYLGYGLPNLIPPYLANVDPWVGEVAADNRYVAVVGDDPLADFFWGRLPVNTPEETAAVVAKILSYHQTEGWSDWQRQALFIADNADAGGNFAGLSDQLIAGYLPVPYEPERVYLGITHPYENPAVAARAAIVEAINGGRLLVNYIGHGTIVQLAAERMLRWSDADVLNNGNTLPLFLFWACLTAQYNGPWPHVPAIGEVMLRDPDGGAIAVWGSTGLGLAAAHRYMEQGLYSALFRDDLAALGPAVMAGNLRLYQSVPGYGYHLENFVLLGDPALELALLPADLTLRLEGLAPEQPLAGEPVTLTLALANAGPATAHHLTLAGDLPQGWVLEDWSAEGITLTLLSTEQPLWQVEDMPTGTNGTLTMRVRTGEQAGEGVLLFAVETSSREGSERDNQVKVGVNLRPRLPAWITVAVDPPFVSTGGRAALKVQVWDESGHLVPDGTEVTLTADGGSVWPEVGYTTGGGFRATFTAGAAPGEAWVTLTSGPTRLLVRIPILAQPTRMGRTAAGR